MLSASGSLRLGKRFENLVAARQGVQKPEFNAGKDARDFYVGKLSSDERKTIALASPLPVLLPVGNVVDQDDPSISDTLGLRSPIDDLLSSRSSRGRGTGYALWRTAAQPGAYFFTVGYKKGAQVAATVSLLRYPDDAKIKPQLVDSFPVTAAQDRLPGAIVDAVVRRLSAKP